MPKPFEQPPPLPRQCAHFVVRKRRYCRLAKLRESDQYCPSHAAEVQSQDKDSEGQQPDQKKARTRKRVPCPIDGKHSVYEDQLRFHLKVCEAGRVKKRIESPAYFSRGINEDPVVTVGEAVSSSSQAPGASTGSNAEGIPEWKQQAAQVAAKVDTVLQVMRDAHPYLFEPAFNTEIHEPQLSKETNQEATDTSTTKRDAKHGRQERSIVGHLRAVLGGIAEADTNTNDDTESHLSRSCSKEAESTKALVPACRIDTAVLEKSRVVFVEMGAGKGGLTSAARDYFPSEPHHYCMVDRSVFSNKRVQLQPGVSRIRIDIRHLDLAKLPPVLNESIPGSDASGASASASAESDNAETPKRRSDTRMALISKHLCGPATCYTLRAAINGLETGDVITVALCCHQLLDWDAYIARDILQAHGVSKEDFEVIVRMTSWAVSGIGRASSCCPATTTDKGKFEMCVCLNVALIKHTSLVWLYDTIESA
jgi:tRNA:m4X modification enzyme